MVFPLVLAAAAASMVAAASPPAVAVAWEDPVVVHQSCDGVHAWFSSVVQPLSPSDRMILTMSLGGDGTPCPPPGKPAQNCSMTQLGFALALG